MSNLLKQKSTIKVTKDITSLSKEDLANYINKYLSECDREYIMSTINKPSTNNIKVNDKVKKVYYCTRCHKKISEPESIKLGMGSICYKKWLSELYTNRYKKLF